MLAYVLAVGICTTREKNLNGVARFLWRHLVSDSETENNDCNNPILGRLIDHVKKGNTSLSRVSILTIDEADRMFELGMTVLIIP